jgi:hypothetical protein
MIAWLLSVLIAIVSSATPMRVAERGDVVLPSPPAVLTESPTQVDAWREDGCTYTRIGGSVITAAHCGVPAGWQRDGDIAWSGPAVDWANPDVIPRGATLWAVGYPAARHGAAVVFTLAVVGVMNVPLGSGTQLTLMSLGDGIPCTPGSSGMIAWVSIDNEARPVGPLSVYSVDPKITSLPVGQYVCSFAIGPGAS